MCLESISKKRKPIISRLVCETRFCTHTRVRSMCEGLMPWKRTVAACFVAAKARTSSENWEWSKCRTRCWSSWRCPPVLPAPGPQFCCLQRCCFSEHTVSGWNNKEEKRLPDSLLSTAPFSFPHRPPASACHCCYTFVFMFCFCCITSSCVLAKVFFFSTSVTFILKT